MREGAKLPAALWPEINRAAVYLQNRTPGLSYDWKTPYERFHTYLDHRDGVVIDSKKPQQAHLRVYGCKAYVLTTEALKKSNRLQRFNPKAWIGYLVGYDSTNKYRIWNPKLNKIVSTRDVIFDEDSCFDGDIKKLQDDLLHIDLNELTELLTHLEQSGSTNIDEISGDANEDEPVVVGGFDIIDDQPIGSDEINPEISNDELALEMSKDLSYPTPSPSPPVALLTASMDDFSNNDLDPFGSAFEVWKAAFHAGPLAQSVGTLDHKIIDRAKIQRFL
jgi:hypothetical protein